MAKYTQRGFGASIDYDELSTELQNKFLLASPVGAVTGWLKNLTNTPALPSGWVECNGQVLSDAESVYNGVTLPSLNTTNLFLRGNATSGTTGGTATHNHAIPTGTRFEFSTSGGSSGTRPKADSTSSGDHVVSTVNNEPPYYNIVWIMRIK